MYSKELDQLIQTVIADGKITDKERAVLHKKAAAEGVDADEIDVYLDGLMLQIEKKAQLVSTSEKDFSVLEKIVDRCILYRMKTPVKLKIKNPTTPNCTDKSSTCPLQELSVNLFYVEKSPEGKHDGRVGIQICFKKVDDFCFTSAVIVELSDYKFGTRDYFYGDDEMVGGRAATCLYFGIEMEALQQLCKSPLLQISFSFRLDWKDHTAIAGVQQDFSSFAQVFYRAAIDSSAYPDATYNGVVKKKKEKLDITKREASAEDDTVARVLSTDPKRLNSIVTDAPTYKQYFDPDNRINVLHMNSSINLEGKVDNLKYTFHLFLHAAGREDDKLEYFLELTCSGGEQKDEQGQVIRKIPFKLVSGDIRIAIGTKDYMIAPLTRNPLSLQEQLGRTEFSGKGDEHCFYPVSDDLMERLMQVKNFDIVVRNETESCKLTAPMGSPSIGRKWKLAYNLLMHPEQKEQLLKEYEEHQAEVRKRWYIATVVCLVLVLILIISC